MRLLIQFSLLIFLVGFWSCEKETIKTNEVFKSGDLKIKFQDYTDWRCPEGATCISAGDCDIYIDVTNGDESTSFTMTSLGSDTIIYNHKIEFVDLLPYPKSGEEIKFKDKEVKLKVTKL